LFSQKVSLIIPAYNEASRLPNNLTTCLIYLQSHFTDYEVLVVDDGSRDSTPTMVKQFQKDWPQLKLIENKRNRGKGHSVKKGILQSSGEFVFFTDADLSTPIKTLREFLELLTGQDSSDVVIGTRKVAEANITKPQPLRRRVIGKVYTHIANLLLRTGISDFNCGFKGFKREAAQAIFSRMTINGWGFDTELLFVARRLGYRVKEVPVEWANSADSRVKIIRDSARSLSDLMHIRLKGWRGLYDR